MGPNPALKVFSFFVGAGFFLVALFLKLCYTTALFATLAEIHRRIQVFRQNRRPDPRALLLLPVVVVFVSLVLFLLSAPRILAGATPLRALAGFRINPMDVVWMGLRLGFLLAAPLLGIVLGIILGRGGTVAREPFGGVVVPGRWRTLGFWTGAFAVAGFFRLMPWGFVTYWTVWVMILAASMVLGLLYTLYGQTRSVLARPSPGPGPAFGGLSLSAAEAAVLGVLWQRGRPVAPGELAAALKAPPPPVAIHPGWAERAHALSEGGEALGEVLKTLSEKGLAARSPQGWEPSGGAQALAAARWADRAAALTVKEPGRAKTAVVHFFGPSAVVSEPGPVTLEIRRVPEGRSPASALVEAAR
ncbi:MAG: hypothetical protein ACP5VN_04115 [Acidobacteriota bacterium]